MYIHCTSTSTELTVHTLSQPRITNTSMSNIDRCFEQVCAVVMAYTLENPWGITTKSCMPTAECDTLATENTDYCLKRPDPRCAYCYDCSYCNYDPPTRKIIGWNNLSSYVNVPIQFNIADQYIRTCFGSQL